MKPEHLIIHCSDSTWGTGREIDSWHRKKGFKHIGYNFTVLNGHLYPRTIIPLLDGSIEAARRISVKGAHAYGYNSNSLGICFIGKKDFTQKQYDSGKGLCLYLMEAFSIPLHEVLGHYEVATDGRTCPNFDMDEFRGFLSADKPTVPSMKVERPPETARYHLRELIAALVKKRV